MLGFAIPRGLFYASKVESRPTSDVYIHTSYVPASRAFASFSFKLYL